MIRLLWIADDPRRRTTSALMSLPVCRGLAAAGMEVTYLALGARRPPEMTDGVMIVPPIVQDPLEPEGLGGVRNLFNYLYKRVGPDIVVLCLDEHSLRSMLRQIRYTAERSLPVLKWLLPGCSEMTGLDNVVLSLPAHDRQGGSLDCIPPAVEPPDSVPRGEAVMSIGRDLPRLYPDRILAQWQKSGWRRHPLLWIADDAARAKIGIETASEYVSRSMNVEVWHPGPLEGFPSSWQGREGAWGFLVESPERLNTIGAAECVLAGLAPCPLEDWPLTEPERRWIPGTPEAWKSEDDLRELAAELRRRFDPRTVINRWRELIESRTRRGRVSLRRTGGPAGVNLKGHIWGNGSMSLTMRHLALAFDDIGVPVSMEATTAKGPEQCAIRPSDRDLNRLLRFAGRKIDPARYAHIRYSGPQPSEHHLLEGLVDLTPGRPNILYWSIDFSTLGGPGCPSPRLIHRAARQVWVPSSHNVRALAESGVRPELIRIVPNGYDNRIFRPDPERERTDKSVFTFLCVANLRFFHRKGIDALVNAYVEAFSDKDDVRLIIQSSSSAERSPVMNCIREANRKFGRKPRIEIRDKPLSPRELAPLYQSADCLVLPSRGESFGLPPLEAMAVGTPAIVTGWGGMTDYCNSDNAYLIEYKLSPANTWVLEGWGGGLWAEPNTAHLSSLMRHAYEHPEELREKGRRASFDAQAWTWTNAACKARLHLSELGLEPINDTLAF